MKPEAHEDAGGKETRHAETSSAEQGPQGDAEADVSARRAPTGEAPFWGAARRDA
eukprot:CAMPEP_0176300316 /NCGR_PEP_ID=MMETSP0121_2-20121125/60258_1 /TAXON_ID=160619 /ORGANISM="Kryptoperidinium foliaceum, Strain CCMP 1326" /LENGTH=54 /DNA_ID=CAMNT_0017641699 /DNA_START=68 /DNA_END=233 /DNA_ORIENTATION=-